jgi:hypothetical protein
VHGVVELAGVVRLHEPDAALHDAVHGEVLHCARQTGG